jgi:hypothetical protein
MKKTLFFAAFLTFFNAEIFAWQTKRAGGSGEIHAAGCFQIKLDACWTDSFEKGLYRVEKNGRSGLYDATGKVVQSMK